MSNDLCLSCDAKLTFQSLESYFRVTSDVKKFRKGSQIAECKKCGLVQKYLSNLWLEEVKEIYSSYNMFHQSYESQEQKVFVNDKNLQASRSEVVFEAIYNKALIKKNSKILDVGCGNGPTLRVLSKRCPQAELFGFEITSKNVNSLLSIPNFKKLYSGSLDEINESFDLIILFHSLEHMFFPKQTLSVLYSKLNPNGKFLIQVPNVRKNFYDILVADHSVHFCPNTLSAMVRDLGDEYKASLEIVNVLPKEVTLLVSLNKALNDPQPNCNFEQNILITCLNSLQIVRNKAILFFEQNRACKLGIFGTSIAATWLAAEVADHVTFFVDEDSTRVGNTHEGLPIHSLENIPLNAKIFVPPMSDNDKSLHLRLKFNKIDYESVNNDLLWR